MRIGIDFYLNTNVRAPCQRPPSDCYQPSEHHCVRVLLLLVASLEKPAYGLLAAAAPAVVVVVATAATAAAAAVVVRRGCGRHDAIPQ
jgi:hypothetical protein